MSNHKYVLVESPFAGEVEENLAYAQKCMRHVFFSGYQQIPIASHCFFTLALDDHNPHERTIGMQAGFAMRSLASETRVYLDRGLSNGMIHGIRHAIETGKTISLWAFDPDSVDLAIREKLQILPQPLGEGLKTWISKAGLEEQRTFDRDEAPIYYGGNMPIRLESATRAAGSKLQHG